MSAPRLVLVLSENWTLVPWRDLPALVRIAREAEDAGFDGVMVSEHVVLGPGADAAGRPSNRREYALPGNQDPRTPWPDPLLLLAAVASATRRLRLIASSVIAPRRHPLALAKQLATLDLRSEGRLVVQPTVGWHREEYEALGVEFDRRGDLLDEHLEAWGVAWRESPAAYDAHHYRFSGAYLEPKPSLPEGPPLWFGGGSVHDRLVRRLVRYGSGFNPLGQPSDEDLARLQAGMREAARDPAELEMIGGVRGRFPDGRRVADLGEALARIPPQIERGFTTFCLKPSRFVEDVAGVRRLLRDVMRRVEAMRA